MLKALGSERALMMQTFYEHALKGEVTKFKYPEIEPSCMAHLETLLNKTITVQDVMFLRLYAIKDLGQSNLPANYSRRMAKIRYVF